MKRVVILIATVGLLLLSATVCLAIFPKPDYPLGNSRRIRLGWYNNSQAWYLIESTGANDINTFRQLTGNRLSWLSPKLSSLLHPRVLGGDAAARPMYIVLNPGATQGPVFSAAPGQDPPDMLYSGFWQVFYVLWKAGVTPRPIINATLGDPLGLPPPAEADILPTGIVIQFPIAALGPLGGPWLPAPPGRYRIKQALVNPDYPQTKFIALPEYIVSYSDYITQRVRKDNVAIPDVSDIGLANLLGANYAPGLLNVPDGTIDPDDNDTQAFYSIPDSPWLCQYPIVEAWPDHLDRRQRNPAFTPVVRLIVLDRNIPYWTVISTQKYVELLLATGGLAVIDDEDRMGVLFIETEG